MCSRLVVALGGGKGEPGRVQSPDTNHGICDAVSFTGEGYQRTTNIQCVLKVQLKVYMFPRDACITRAQQTALASGLSLDHIIKPRYLV